MRGCNDPACCPPPRRRTKREKYMDERLDFINALAEIEFLEGRKLTEYRIPKSYLDCISLYGISTPSDLVYVTDYGIVQIEVYGS